jgi:hypothetical protein
LIWLRRLVCARDLRESHKPGGHESSYWDNRWDDYLSFYAKALARC